MLLSDDSKWLFADFFDHIGFCSKDEFPDIYVYSGSGARVLTAILIVDGITLGTSVFVHRRFVRRDAHGKLLVSKTLMAHEIVHVLQYTKEGYMGFLKAYIGNFWKLFRGRKEWTARAWFESYLLIPHEIEARELAAKFKPWLRARNR